MTTKKRTFKKIWLLKPEVGEVNTLPSMTVPDQSMDLRTIIDRFTSGLLPPIGKELQYSEDMPDLRGLDISELFQMRNNVIEHQQEIQAQIAEYEAQELSKKEREKLQKLKEEWSREQQNPNPKTEE